MKRFREVFNTTALLNKVMLKTSIYKSEIKLQKWAQNNAWKDSELDSLAAMDCNIYSDVPAPCWWQNIDQ